MPRRANLPVYFTNLIVENVRSFAQRQELNLVNPDGRPAGWTLIVGENGVGKTTLLQCLARMRPVFNEKSKMIRVQLPTRSSRSWRARKITKF